MDLVDGAVITLQCQSPIPGPAFLDGTTAEATVGLAPRTDGIYTGTHWQVTTAAEGFVTLACAGTTQGPRYLQARGTDQPLGLAPDTEPPFIRTRWWVRSVGDDLVTLHSQDGALLSGLTDPAIRSVTVSTTDPAPGGTRWRVAVLAHPRLTIQTTRTDTGATLELHGDGFTSHDLVHFTAEGVFGDGPRLPQPLGGTGRTDKTGTFAGLVAEITLPESQPNNPRVVVRAVDRHGLTATSTTDAFCHAP